MTMIESIKKSPEILVPESEIVPQQEEEVIVIDEIDGVKSISLEKGQFNGARTMLKREGEFLGKIE